MNGDAEGPWTIAWSRAQAGFGRFTRSPGSARFSGVAAVILILSTMAPWIEQGGAGLSDSYPGINANTGQLCLLAGVAAIMLLARLIRQQRGADSGAIAALGLLALLLIASEAIYLSDSSHISRAWGMYVSAGAAFLMMLGGFTLLGGQDRDPGQERAGADL